MKKTKLKCAVCSGNLVYDEESDQYQCVECDATHSPELFSSQGRKKLGIKLKKLRVLIAILAAAYLFYWILRILVY
jgi:hypothetical protein